MNGDEGLGLETSQTKDRLKPTILPHCMRFITDSSHTVCQVAISLIACSVETMVDLKGSSQPNPSKTPAHLSVTFGRRLLAVLTAHEWQE